MNIAIIYASIEGHTSRIAQFVQETVTKEGHSSTLVDAGRKAPSYSFDGIDKIIMAAPVHRKRHPVKFENFLRTNREGLTEYQTLLFSISLCAAFYEGIGEAYSYVNELSKRSKFSPSKVVLLAGALQFDKYHDYESQVVRFIGLELKRYESIKSDREFTNWQTIEKNVCKFLKT